MSQLAQPHVSPPTAPQDTFCDAGLVIGTPVLTLEGELPPSIRPAFDGMVIELAA